MTDQLLHYAIKTNPAPLQASPVGQAPADAVLSVIATNGTASAVDLQGVSLTIPYGSKADQLTPATTGMKVTPPAGWVAQGPVIDQDAATLAFVFQPKTEPATLAKGAALDFSIAALPINSAPGSAKLVITEGSGGCAPPDCPTSDQWVTKFPSGWGAVSFASTEPNIGYKQPTRVTWNGPPGATYSIEYSLPGQPVINVPADGAPAFGASGTYPATTDPPLLLEQTTTFTLSVSAVIDGITYADHLQTTVTVAQPAPTVTGFAGQVSAADGSVNYTWSSQHADYTLLSADPSAAELAPSSPAKGVNYQSAQGAFGATLTAVNQTAQASARLVPTWEFLTTNIPFPGGMPTGIAVNLAGTRIATLPDGGIAAVYERESTDGLTWKAGPRITLPSAGIAIYVAMSPDGTLLFLLTTTSLVTIDIATGKQVGSAFDSPMGGAMAVDPARNRLYVASSGIHTYNISVGSTTPLTPIGKVVPGAMGVTVSPNGDYLYAVGAGLKSLVRYRVQTDESEPLVADSTGPALDATAGSLACSPSGDTLLGAPFDSSNGLLMLIDAKSLQSISDSPKTGGLSLAQMSNQNRVYVNNMGTSQVALLRASALTVAHP